MKGNQRGDRSKSSEEKGSKKHTHELTTRISAASKSVSILRVSEISTLERAPSLITIARIGGKFHYFSGGDVSGCVARSTRNGTPNEDRLAFRGNRLQRENRPKSDRVKRSSSPATDRRHGYLAGKSADYEPGSPCVSMRQGC